MGAPEAIPAVEIESGRWVRVDGDYLIPFDPARSAQLLVQAPRLPELQQLRYSVHHKLFDRICFYKLSDIVIVSAIVQVWSRQKTEIFLIDVGDYTSAVAAQTAANSGLAPPERLSGLSDWFQACRNLQVTKPHRIRRSLMITEYDTPEHLRCLIAELSFSRLHSHSVLYLPSAVLLNSDNFKSGFEWSRLGRWASFHSIVLAWFDSDRGLWREMQPEDAAVSFRPSHWTAIYEAPVKNLTACGIKNES